jgi:hypothetical protein
MFDEDLTDLSVWFEAASRPHTKAEEWHHSAADFMQAPESFQQ